MNTVAPLTMKAIIFHENGSKEVLGYEDVPVPTPGPGEVLIRVESCSVNRGLDTMVRENGFGFPGFSLPHVSGADPAGTVAAVGEGVESGRVGDRVVVYPLIPCGECDFCLKNAGENYCRNYRVIGVQTWGGYAEFVRVPERNAIPIPDGVSFEVASAFPVSYLPAYHGIVTLADLTREDTILVMAAGSGIGMAAIDIATSIGARVIATAGSPWKLERARALGADVAISYENEDWAAQVRAATGGRGVNVAFDNIGGETWSTSVSLLDRAGRMVCSGATGVVEATINLRDTYRNMTRMFFNTQGTSAELRLMLSAAQRGELAPVIDRIMPLQDAVAAQDLIESRQFFGKIMLTPPGSAVQQTPSPAPTQGQKP